MTAQRISIAEPHTPTCPNCTSERIGEQRSYSSTMKRLLLSGRPVDLDVLSFAENSFPPFFLMPDDGPIERTNYSTCHRCRFLWHSAEPGSGIRMDKFMSMIRSGHCGKYYCTTCGGSAGYLYRFERYTSDFADRLARMIGRFRPIEVCAMVYEVRAAFRALPSTRQTDVLRIWSRRWRQDCESTGAVAARFYQVVYSQIVPDPLCIGLDSNWISASIDYAVSSRNPELTKSLFLRLGSRSMEYPQLVLFGIESFSREIIDEFCRMGDESMRRRGFLEAERVRDESERIRREAQWNHPDAVRERQCEQERRQRAADEAWNHPDAVLERELVRVAAAEQRDREEENRQRSRLEEVARDRWEQMERSRPARDERDRALAELAELSVEARLRVIGQDRRYPLHYYPSEWADVDDPVLHQLDESTIRGFTHRGRGRVRGQWKTLVRRLRDMEHSA